MRGSWHHLNVYYRTYNRALLKYVNNGFFSRDLDADDHAFLEKVREQGCCDNGSLVSAVPTAINYGFVSQRPLDEEREYWRKPFAGEPFRRVMVPRLPEDPAVRAARMTRRQREREMMAAELEAARKEWAAQQEERKRNQLRRLKDDLDWEGADPKKRHYEPLWKREERLAPERRRLAKIFLKQKRADAKRDAERDRLEALQAAEYAKHVRLETATQSRLAAQISAKGAEKLKESIAQTEANVAATAAQRLIAESLTVDEGRLPRFNPPYCDLKKSIQHILNEDPTVRRFAIEGVRVHSLPHWLVLCLMSRSSCGDIKMTISCLKECVFELVPA